MPKQPPQSAQPSIQPNASLGELKAARDEQTRRAEMKRFIADLKKIAQALQSK